MFIYKIVNNESSKTYVGMTKRTVEKRFKSHLYEAHCKKYNMYLHNAIRKHGDSKFSVYLIEECIEDDAPVRECYWIKVLNTIQPNGYNEHSGGKGGCLNASLELRKKLSIAKKGKTPWNKGLNKLTDLRVANNALSISKAKKGIKFTEEHKNNMRKSKK